MQVTTSTGTYNDDTIICGDLGYSKQLAEVLRGHLLPSKSEMVSL